MVRRFVHPAVLTLSLGCLLHVLAVICMFDIYFRSPVVHGMTPHAPRGVPPAKRLVLFVADGLRADKLFELEDEVPFLREIVHTKGAWGLSHTRVPTESRPGHVAMISGFYEDVSAVTTGWKENPVEFDSVFNQSRWTWSWGSPDILPMFSKNHEDHVFAEMYSGDNEDFAKDASALDHWVFSRVEEFFEKAKEDQKLKERLKEDKVVLFLHLLGLDTVGHSKRPYSDAYRDNIINVDKGVQRIHKIAEDFFGDESTAYVFTSDHGMSDKGNHGDGERANTETPLIAWGAGVRTPHHAESIPSELQPKYIDKLWTIESPKNWKLNHIRRVDVNQADVAPLMSSLIGINFPLNSVGILPTEYLDKNPVWTAESALANARSIFAQVEVQSHIKAAHTFFFRPYSGLTSSEAELTFEAIQRLISDHKYDMAVRKSEIIMNQCLEALNYYQTYDRLSLLILTTVSYVSWMAFVALHLLPGSGYLNLSLKQTPILVAIAFLSITSVAIYLQSSPVQYYLYFALPTFLVAFVFLNSSKISEFFVYALERQNSYQRSLPVVIFVSILLVNIMLVEIQVAGFFERKLFGVCLFLLGIWGLFKSIPFGMKLMWLGSTTLVGMFTFFPIGADNIPLVGGIGVAALSLLFMTSQVRAYFDAPETDDHAGVFVRQKIQVTSSLFLRSLSGISCTLLFLQRISASDTSEIYLLLMACWLVYSTESSLAKGNGLPTLNSALSLLQLLFALLSCTQLPKDSHFLDVFIIVVLYLATPFVLLYEVWFFISFVLMLITWIAIEKHIQETDTKQQSKKQKSTENTGNGKPLVSLRDVRIAMFYVLFCWVAFFGTGNVASVSSFQISSTYRFLTVFNPFKMGALLIVKLLLPFALVSVVFGIINKMLNTNLEGSFYIVLIATDFMALNFFFLVKDSGSWLDIGTSISHFCGTNGFILMHMALFGLSRFILRGGLVFDRKKHVA